MNISSMPWTLNEKTRSTSPLCGADRQEGYTSNYTLKMALWFISYATTSIIFIVYRARKSRTTLQNKVRLKVLPEQLTLFVNTSVTFKKCIIQ